jgi:DNA-binding response OmpR family regulator
VPVSLDENDLAEFKNEALELIEEAEKKLLEVERGQEFKPRYDAVFRCFHSLKGAAGMLELENLRSHMHKLEDLFAKYKESVVLGKNEINFFLSGIDSSRRIIEGDIIEFDFSTLSGKSAEIISAISQPVDVFIIDDEEDLVDILSTYMTKIGLTWKGFTNSLQAAEEFEKNLPKLVISDLSMPKLDGIGVLKKLREHSKDVPLIFISAHLSKESLIEAVSQGVSGVIEKPFKEANVVAQVSQTLHQSEMNDLLNRTFEVLMFQMPDLEKYLVQNNKHEILRILKSDVTQLLSARRKMKSRLSYGS